MKKDFFWLLVAAILLLSSIANAQTSFVPTTELFGNGEKVYSVIHNGITVGQFWPVKDIMLVTKETLPAVFKKSLSDIVNQFQANAVAPGSMTGRINNEFRMQGYSLAQGAECGDGILYDYGIIISVNGKISFTHKREIENFDSLYQSVKAQQGTLLFLPSIYRLGKFLPSEKVLDKVIVRRDTYAGEQIGVIVFNQLITYNEARSIVLGLDIPDRSTTTHIYMLDGGPSWGQSCKKVNGQYIPIGTRDQSVVTNYLLLYN